MPQWVEISFRTLCSIAVLFLLTRILGKRQITQISFFEYITGITIGSLATYVSLETQSPWYLGVVSLAIWVVVSLGIEFLQLKSKKARDLIDGKATILIQDGKILEDNLKKERLTSDDLLSLLRRKNVYRAADVEFAIMEADGDLNVLLKKEHQPLTPNQLGIKVAPEPEPQAVIMDGKIMDNALARKGLSRQWLLTELEKLGLAPDNVYLAQVDAYNQLYVDTYDDQLSVPEPQQKAALLAQLKKCEADLEMFALSTEDEGAKQLYGQCSQHMQQVIDAVRPYLTGG